MSSVTTPVRGIRRAGAVLATAALVGTSLTFGASAAFAAPDSITVTTTALNGPGSFRAALEAANASTNPDGVSIGFDAALASQEITFPNGLNVNSMTTSRVGHPSGNVATSIGELGARFLIDSTVPVSVDFANIKGFVDSDASHAAGIYVASDNVTLSNLGNFLAAEAAIVIGGEGTKLNNVKIEDPSSHVMEIGVALLDGANNTSIVDLTVYSPYWASIVVDTAATVTNTAITGFTSRGVENIGHVDIEDGATVTNFSVENSVLGAIAEASPTHGFYINPNVTTSNLEFVDSAFASPSRHGFYFEGAGQTLTDTVIAGNTFGGEAGKVTLQTIEHNAAVWNGLNFVENTLAHAGGIVFAGSLSNAVIAGNDFDYIRDAGQAAVQLGNTLSNVRVDGNTFNRIWAIDTIQATGTATDVKIVNNEITNLTADISRSAVRINAPGTGNEVAGNTITQKNNDAGMHANSWNHWAVYNTANAASKDVEVGWSITNNSIDGFGWDYINDRPLLNQAPIVHNAVGKLPVTGNTFGAHTNGSASTDVEHAGNWFFWNVGNTVSNNTVQTYQADEVSIDGTTDEVTFKAVKPANQPANNDATAPVTLHVYWTAANHAEVYLGQVNGVEPNDTVTVGAKGNTGGFVRVQTVDENGFTSQYSSIDPDAPSSIPAAPAVTKTTDTTATGTGVADAIFTVYDAEGNVVDTGDIDADGNWAASELTCGTTYTATQTVNSVESAPTEFTTAACAVDPDAPAAPKVTEVTPKQIYGTGQAGASVLVRDANGKVVSESVVAENGTWAVDASKLSCGTTYTVEQAVDGVSSALTPFKTADCPAAGGDTGDKLASTGNGAMFGGVASAMVLLIAGGAVMFMKRRRMN